MNPLLGWISPENRTQGQMDAHEAAVKSFVRFAMEPVKTDGPVKVMLTDHWKDPLVIADIGYAFTGFRQLSGSCVGVSTGDAVFTLGSVQRALMDSPTKAFVPWWPFMYGTCRYNEGDRGQGEGAVDSVMAQTLIKNGVMPYDQATGVPQFDKSDGFALTENEEMTYSNGQYSGNTQFASIAAKYPVGSAAPLSSVQDIKTAILNGYPVLDGCDYYIGNGSISGDVAIGNYDGRGGHSTCYLGYWDHPNQGPLYLYSNQWSGSTYPQDGSGRGRCTVWVKEANVATLFRNGGSGGETIALSHLTYFPAQPAVLNYIP